MGILISSTARVRQAEDKLRSMGLTSTHSTTTLRLRVLVGAGIQYFGR